MSAGVFVRLTEMRKPLTIGKAGIGAVAGEDGVAPFGSLRPIAFAITATSTKGI